MQTYFQQEGRIGARRDWLVSDASTGEALGCATSSWVMLNFKTRRLSKLPDEAAEDYRKLMPDPPQHSITKEQTRLKLPEVSDKAECRLHTPSSVHTDMNNHVNNTAYLTWILDSIPADVQEQCILAQYEVDYKAEALLGAQAPLWHMHMATQFVEAKHVLAECRRSIETAMHSRLQGLTSRAFHSNECRRFDQCRDGGGHGHGHLPRYRCQGCQAVHD